jgi:hypothetical protein
MDNTQLIINVIFPIRFEEIFSEPNLRIYKSHSFWSVLKRWEFCDILTIDIKVLVGIISLQGAGKDNLAKK